MKFILTLSLFVALSAAYPYPQDSADARQGGGHGYGKQPDGYFQYVNVPAHKEYEFGWNRGNPHHYISRYEQAKDHRFRTRVRWGDKHGGYGEHYWEYNHAPKYDHHGGYGKDDHHGGYGKEEPHHGGYGKEALGGALPGFSEEKPVYAAPPPQQPQYQPN